MALARRAFLGMASGLIAPGRAGAQARPGAFLQHGVRYIVPFTPSGITDVMARLVAQKLAVKWRQPVTVQNIPGVSAAVGVDAAFREKADGHTLLAVTLTHAANASLFPNLPYDLLLDFAPICIISESPLVICVNPGSTLRNLRDLMQSGSEQRLHAGSTGTGSPAQLALEMLRLNSGAAISFCVEAYRGGAPAAMDLVAGNIDLLISNLPECLGYLKEGRLRGLAVTDHEPHRLLQDIPAVGRDFPQLVIKNWTAMLVKSGRPASVREISIRQEIERDVLDILGDPELRRRAGCAGFQILGKNASESRIFIEDEMKRWRNRFQTDMSRKDWAPRCET